MTAGDATALLGGLAEHGVDACVGGGWAVDALLGTQTREHADLDLWVPALDLEPRASSERVARRALALREVRDPASGRLLIDTCGGVQGHSWAGLQPA